MERGDANVVHSPAEPSGASGKRGEAKPTRRPPLKRVLGLSVAAVAVAVAVAAFVPVSYEAITPGTGVEISTLVRVPRSLRHHHRGAVVLTDVELIPLHALEYLYFRLQGGDQVVPTNSLTGPASSAQYDEEGVIDMDNARQAATVVALRALGYHPRVIPDGVIVYETVPGSPAAARLRVGQVIISLDGHPELSVAALERAVAQHPPGTAVTVGTQLTEADPSGAHLATAGPTGVGPGQAVHEVRLHLGKVRVATTSGQVVEHCLPAGTRTSLRPPPPGVARSCLGIAAPSLASEQAYRVTQMPFSVSLSSDGIVGPSAGLSFTLGLLDVLSSGNLTGGRRVAATGTMSIGGQVGPVGGVAQKTAAVRAAGATVFLVPTAQVSVAQAHAGPRLKVLGVSTIGQAIADLRRLGGRIGPRPLRARP